MVQAREDWSWASLKDPGVRANVVGLVANLALALAKFTLGTLAGSAALVADGFNSAGDIVATLIGWAGYHVAQRPPDENHHYGHGKFESAAGLIIGGLLLATGIFVTIEGVRNLLSGPRPPPELLALWVALGTAVVKEALYQYVSRVGRRLNAPSLLASARDHRADVFIAVTVLAGIVGARVGWTWLDPAAAGVIGLYIAWMAWEPIRSNLGVLMDEAPQELMEAVREQAATVEPVRRVDLIRIHPHGSHYYVDLEISVDGSLSLREAHDVAHAVEERLVSTLEHVRDVTVHVNPFEAPPRNARSRSRR